MDGDSVSARPVAEKVGTIIAVRRQTIPFVCGLLGIVVVATPAHPQKRADSAWVVPVEARWRANPVLASSEAITRGREIYLFACAQCHGVAGRGDGPQAPALMTRPADLASARVRSQSDGALFWKITGGRCDMPKPRLEDQGVWTVLDFIRTIPARS
jgi:mono/diheme cytochrome c family protein